MAAQRLGADRQDRPAKPDPTEPGVPAESEKRAFARTLAMGQPGGWTLAMSRFARESQPPADSPATTSSAKEETPR